MEEIFKNHIETARADFMKQVELMKPQLYTKDRVVFENFVLAYDLMFDALTEANKISSNSVLADSICVRCTENAELVGEGLCSDCWSDMHGM